MNSEYTFRGLHIHWGDGPMAIVDPGGSTRLPADWTPAELAIIAEFLVLDDAEQERCLSSTAASSAAAAEDVAVDVFPVDATEVAHPRVRAPKLHGAAADKARRQRIHADNVALDAQTEAELRAAVTQSAGMKSKASIPGAARHVYYTAPADSDVGSCKVGHWHGLVDGFRSSCRYCSWRSGDGR